MKPEHVYADVELRHRDRVFRVKALVDTGASRSVISKRLADMLGCFIPLEKPYELRTADEGGRPRVVGRCIVGLVFQGVEVPGGAVFEVAEKPEERRGPNHWEARDRLLGNSLHPGGAEAQESADRVRNRLTDQSSPNLRHACVSRVQRSAVIKVFHR